MSFDEIGGTRSTEQIRLCQRDGQTGAHNGASEEWIEYDVYHTYSVEVGDNGYTRQYTNHLVVKFLLEENRQVPDQFYAARRTRASSSRQFHQNLRY